MRKRRPIIKDKKERGEWAEAIFLVRARAQGLPVSKPWGDARGFDFVVGGPGHFLAVQVKCTIFELEDEGGYICSICSCNRPYPPGSFDFLAAYLVYEDAWYIIPEKEILGLKSISLGTQNNEAKYEMYREAWQLLRRPKPAKIGHMEACADDACVEDVRGEYDWAQKFRPVMLPPRSVLPHLASMCAELVRRRCGQLLYGV
jgi:hypothetical protein